MRACMYVRVHACIMCTCMCAGCICSMYVCTYVCMHACIVCSRAVQQVAMSIYMYMYACMCERMCLMGSDDIDHRPACVLLNVSCFSRDSIAQPFWYIVRTLMHEVASYNLVEGFCADGLIA